jgi:predicted RNA-binding Zn-ribbon protein involved in translation (DUF1610 family)
MKQGYHLELTPKELKFVLFGNKKCPNCGNKLKKYTVVIMKKGADVQSERPTTAIFPSNADVRCPEYHFKCDTCGFDRSISELLEENSK